VNGATRLPLVAPFVGERFAAVDRLGALLAPPYDVITPPQRTTLACNPENIVHLILPRGEPNPYTAAARTLAQWRDRGVVLPDERPALTVVQQTFANPDGRERVRTGLIGGIAAEAFALGRVKPHERTHAGPKEDRLALARATRAMFEALLLFARDQSGALQGLLHSVAEREPDARAELDDGTLALWKVDGRLSEKISMSAGQGSLYIGDGHHRYETAIQYRVENPKAARIPALIVPLNDPGVTVLPTHRLIFGGPLDSEKVVSDIRKRFQIRELSNVHEGEQELALLEERGTACVLLLPGLRALALLLKPRQHLDQLLATTDAVVGALDVARLDQVLVAPLVAAAGPSARVGYSARVQEVVTQVAEGTASAGLLLNPTKLAQVLAVADAGQTMPQKSTYFMPKVPSGIVGMDYDK
jgi:uncharacterized protein (DUF1015 family)